MIPLLSVIVPAYREQGTIYASVELLRASLQQLQRPFEILVVSDGNTDATAAEASRHAGPVRVLTYGARRGKGFALRHGIAHARGELVAFIDADMELHPDGIGRLVELVEGGADAAIGSKRHPDSHVFYPPFRRFQSAVYQRLILGLFSLDLADTQTGLKVFRGDLLRMVAPELSSDGFAFDLELLVALHDHGATIVEGPVHLEYQFQSTTGARAVVDVLRDTASIHRRRRRRLGKETDARSGDNVTIDATGRRAVAPTPSKTAVPDPATEERVAARG